MRVIEIQACGVIVFLAGSIWLGRLVRRRDSSGVAEKASRVSHGLFWVALVLPGAIGLFSPGLTKYDALLGLPSLPARPVWIGVGAVLLLSGMALLMGSNRFLMKRGRGAAAFMLTERLVSDGWYGRSRNPMSLGFYAVCLSVGMIAGSLAVTLGALLVIVPVHLFNLKYFEERELELRYGDAYADYQRRVPFLFPQIRPRHEVE